MAKIPAVYKGPRVKLSPINGKVLGLDGKPLKSDIIEAGDVLMLEEAEVLGQTYYFENGRGNQPKHLGAGRVILDKHKSLSPDELYVAGYEFHEGRSDFESYVEVEHVDESESE